MKREDFTVDRALVANLTLRAGGATRKDERRSLEITWTGALDAGRDQHWSAAVFSETEPIFNRDFVPEAP